MYYTRIYTMDGKGCGEWRQRKRYTLILIFSCCCLLLPYVYVKKTLENYIFVISIVVVILRYCWCRSLRPLLLYFNLLFFFHFFMLRFSFSFFILYAVAFTVCSNILYFLVFLHISVLIQMHNKRQSNANQLVYYGRKNKFCCASIKWAYYIHFCFSFHFIILFSFLVLLFIKCTAT